MHARGRRAGARALPPERRMLRQPCRQPTSGRRAAGRFLRLAPTFRIAARKDSRPDSAELDGGFGRPVRRHRTYAAILTGDAAAERRFSTEPDRRTAREAQPALESPRGSPERAGAHARTARARRRTSRFRPARARASRGPRRTPGDARARPCRWNSVLVPAGAPILLGQCGEGDRRRVVADPAPQLVDAIGLYGHGGVT